MSQNSDDTTYSSAQQYGRYRTINLLGKGGMGRVYLSEDPVLKRKVALKVIDIKKITNDQQRKEYIDRFLLEARASASLSHPSIVAVFDAGEENGTPWIAFEFIEGESLDELIKRKGKLSVAKAVTIALDIASALDYAHKNKIVHRDIKPENIIIDKKSGIAKLADFGIVKGPWTDITREGTTVGSPGYMSPEQIDGTDVDERTDLFSLGVVLYQMVAGKHPFSRPDSTSTIFATLRGKYTPLSELLPDIPAELDGTVAQCLKRDRDKRIGSAKELIKLFETMPLGYKPDETGDVPVRIIREQSNVILMSNNKNSIETVRGFFQLLAESFAAARNRVEAASSEEPTQVLPKGRVYNKQFFSPPKWTLQEKIKTIRQIVLFFFQELNLNLHQKYPARALKVAGVSIIAFSIICITAISLLSISIVMSKKRLKEGTEKESLEAAKTLERYGVDFSGEVLTEKCRHYIEKGDLKSAKLFAQNLSKLKATEMAGHILIGKIAIKEENYTEAIENFDLVVKMKEGKQRLKREINSILSDAEPLLKKSKAPVPLISLLGITLEAANEPIVKKWAADPHYWLRWNAVSIMETGSVPVDMVEAYILDLKHAGSDETRIRAAKKLGELDDKRAIPALKEATGVAPNDPSVSERAKFILKHYFGEL